MAMLTGLGLCAGALGFWQVLRADALLARPDNSRAMAEAELTRGRILDRRGQPLAWTAVADGQPTRRYAQGAGAQVLGTHSPRLGNSGLEARYDSFLRGAAGDTMQRLRHRFLGEPLRGADLVTTLDTGLQRVAQDALGNARGAIVALDPRSGAILAMVSAPSFDPNTHDQQWDTLRNDRSAPLLNRAIQATYPPGSTFKTVTASAAVDSGLVNSEAEFRCTTAVQIDGLQVDCRNHAHQAVLNYRQAFAWSCNRTFALTGLLLGLGAPLTPLLDDRALPARPWADLDVHASAERLTHYAEAFGFDRSIPFDLPVTTSRVKGDGDWYPSLLAQTGFGQGELAATPLQMALVAATIANDGQVPAPYLAQVVRLADGSERAPRPLSIDSIPSLRPRAVSSNTARDVRHFMTDSVEYAYAQLAKLPGVAVAGKTGTAETGPGETPHAWFIGFAPAEQPRIAVAVIMEHQGSGSEVATPAARRVMAAALAVGG